MKVIMKSSFVLLLLSGIMLLSCSPLKKAEKSFNNGHYNEAIGLYGKLVNRDDYAAEANFKIGESYRLSNRIRMSAPFYNAAIKLGVDDESAALYYGYALKSRGEYQLAEQEFQKYLENLRTAF